MLDSRPWMRALVPNIELAGPYGFDGGSHLTPVGNRLPAKVSADIAKTLSIRQVDKEPVLVTRSAEDCELL